MICMKKITKITLLALMFFAFGNKLYSQVSTQGKDFWLSFGRNRNYPTVQTQLNLQLRIITGTNPATVTLTYTQSGTVQTVNIAAGEVYTHVFTSTERNRIFSQNTGTTNNSLHIESDVPVSVYALNQVQITTDATNVLPVDGLGTDYYHISYRSCSNDYRDGYTLIATEDNTEIYDEGLLRATLNKGQVYSYYFTGTVDGTGRHITSDKPVAYFVTNGGVWIPYSTGNGADCIYQQLSPVNKWGRNFLVPVTHRGVERIRIMASQDGTVITQSGGIIRTDNNGYGQNTLNLDRGQFVELETNLSSCGCYIAANQPIGVCSYLVGMEYNPPVRKGDPAMAWVPPIEQSINGALIAPFAPLGGTVLNEHYALIVTPTATKDQSTIAIGTTPATGLTGGTWCDNAISGYSFYSLQLTSVNESYYFANPNGLTVMGYGIGDYESYYYLSGSASRDLDAAFYLNNIHYQDLDGGVLCDTIANFRALLQYAQSTTSGYLNWYIDGVLQGSYTDTLEWRKVLPLGNHTVVVEVLDMDDEIVTLSATFDVGYSHYDTIAATICLGDLYRDTDGNFDTVPTTAGFMQISVNKTNTFICDSIITLNLTVNPSYNLFDSVTICDSELPYTYRDTTFGIGTSSDAFVFNRKTLHNCDSITTLELTVNPTYDLTDSVTICDSELPYTYRDTTFGVGTSSGAFVFNRKTVHDCDSITTLELTVNPTYDLTDSVTICDSELPYTYRDTTFGIGTPSGIFVFNRKTVNLCDSITSLALVVNPTYNLTDSVTICDSELPYIYRDTTFGIGTSSGTFVFTRKTVHDCDSIVTLNFIVNSSYYDTINAIVCQYEIYNDYGFNPETSKAGFFLYVNYEKTKENCDSITVLNLTVNPVYDDYRWKTIYEDEFYRIGDSAYRTPGLHIATLQTIEHCDSVINLNLTVIYYPSEITAFSPFNKDGINDYFMAGFKIQVFSRYGVLVYETKTIQERELGWDGRNYKGQEVEPGMYFYILYNSSGKPRIKSSVEVLKRR